MINTIYNGKYKTERKEMIELIRSRGITDENVIRAMEIVPRHLFVNELFLYKAYEDSALPIGSSQTISQPYTIALMTQELNLKPGAKILEIGTGSGYQAAILAEMGCRVFSIERHIELLSEARKVIDKLGYSIVTKCGDGTIGWSEFAPYDGIIVTAGAPEAPQPLLDQLIQGGNLVIPIGTMHVQDLYVYKRNGEKFDIKKIYGFKFVPLIGKKGWQEK